jgi:hypothetical protein
MVIAVWTGASLRFSIVTPSANGPPSRVPAVRQIRHQDAGNQARAGRCEDVEPDPADSTAPIARSASPRFRPSVGDQPPVRHAHGIRRQPIQRAFQLVAEGLARRASNAATQRLRLRKGDSGATALANMKAGSPPATKLVAQQRHGPRPHRRRYTRARIDYRRPRRPSVAVTRSGFASASTNRKNHRIERSAQI